MRIVVVKGLKEVYEIDSGDLIRFEWEGGDRIDVHLNRDDPRQIVLRTINGGLAVLSEAGNVLAVQYVDRGRELQGPRLADPSTVARDLELSASNALHGFNKGASADVRLKKLADTLTAYAKHIREENNGTER